MPLARATFPVPKFKVFSKGAAEESAIRVILLHRMLFRQALQGATQHVAGDPLRAPTHGRAAASTLREPRRGNRGVREQTMAEVAAVKAQRLPRPARSTSARVRTCSTSRIRSV